MERWIQRLTYPPLYLALHPSPRACDVLHRLLLNMLNLVFLDGISLHRLSH